MRKPRAIYVIDLLYLILPGRSDMGLCARLRVEDLPQDVDFWGRTFTAQDLNRDGVHDFEGTLPWRDAV
jgi:hypothetical protein